MSSSIADSPRWNSGSTPLRAYPSKRSIVSRRRGRKSSASCTPPVRPASAARRSRSASTSSSIVSARRRYFDSSPTGGMKLPAWWSIGASPRAKRDRVRSSRIANWRKLGYSARAGSQAKWDCVRSLYVVFSLQARRPYLFTLKTLSPMSEKFAIRAGSSSSACSSTTGAPQAECMCSSGSPRALATGMMSPSLVRAAQPPTYMPLRYSRAQRSLCVKPPLANTTARSARTRTSSPAWCASTPTTRPDSSTKTLAAGVLGQQRAAVGGDPLEQPRDRDAADDDLVVVVDGEDDAAEAPLVLGELVVARPVGLMAHLHRAELHQPLERGRRVVVVGLDDPVLPLGETEVLGSAAS